MSLLKLLAEYPNYSARKVRRLARQLAMIENVAENFSIGEETGLLKSISADLMEFNLQQASLESHLNDDIQTPAVEVETEADRAARGSIS